MRTRKYFAIAVSACLIASAGLGRAESGQDQQPYELTMPLGLDADMLQIPEDNPLTAAKVALGKLLYFDGRLSIDARVLPEGDRDAYVLYMLGREAMNRPIALPNIEEAIGHFNEALAIDTDYPAAHAGLCIAHVLLYELQKDTASIDNAEMACPPPPAMAMSTPFSCSSRVRSSLTL